MAEPRGRIRRRAVVAIGGCLLAATPLALGGAPSRALAAAPDRAARNYVLNQAGKSVTVIATSTGAVITTITGLPGAPTRASISQDGRHLLVAQSAANTVTLIDTRTDAIVKSVSVGSNPVDIASGYTRTYVANRTANSVTVLNNLTGAVSSTIAGACGPGAPAGTLPTSVALLGDQSTLYVACDKGATGILVGRDPSSGGFIYSKPLDGAPTVLAAGPGFSASMFVGYRKANGSGGIDAFSAMTQSIYDSVAYVQSVDGIAPLRSGDRILVTRKATTTLLSIDTNLDTQGSVALTSDTHALAVNPGSTTAMVANATHNTLSLVTISGDTLTLRKTVSGFATPSGLAVEPAVATAVFTIAAAVPGHPTTFDASASTDSAGHIATYDWDFGDGSTASVTTATTTHTYQYGGHNATLTVTDDSGYSDAATFTGHTSSGGSSTAVLTHPVPFANPNHDVVYVPSYGGLHVADPITLRPLGTIALDGDPGWVAVSPNGHWVVKTQTGSTSRSVTIIDATTNLPVRTFTLPSAGSPANPEGVVVGPDNSTGYVADYANGRVDLVALPSGAVTGHISLGMHPYALAYATPLPTPNSGLLLAAGWDSSDQPVLAVVSLALHQVIRTINLHAGPEDLAIAPGSATAYIPTADKTVQAVNILIGLVRDVTLLGASYGVAVRSDGSEIFATDRDNSTLVHFTPFAASATTGANTGYYNQGVALTTSGARVVVVDDGDNDLKVINSTSNAVIGTIDLDPLNSDDPTHVAVAPPYAAPPPPPPPTVVPTPSPSGVPPGVPTASHPSRLPTTGGPIAYIGIVGLVLFGAAVSLRRRKGNASPR